MKFSTLLGTALLGCTLAGPLALEAGPKARPTPPAPADVLTPQEARPGDSASPQGNRGYKDFAWGDSVQAVKRRVPDVESTSGSLLYKAVVGAYLVQYGSLYDVSIPNPLSRVVGKLEMFDSRASNMDFGFVDGKLFVVAVFFTTENPLPSLEQKYGTTPAHTMGRGDYQYTVHAWFADPHRVIVYLRWLREEIDVVAYVDSTVYNKAAAQLVQERKSESKDSLKRID